MLTKRVLWGPLGSLHTQIVLFLDISRSQHKVKKGCSEGVRFTFTATNRGKARLSVNVMLKIASRFPGIFLEILSVCKPQQACLQTWQKCFFFFNMLTENKK